MILMFCIIGTSCRQILVLSKVITRVKVCISSWISPTHDQIVIAMLTVDSCSWARNRTCFTCRSTQTAVARFDAAVKQLIVFSSQNHNVHPVSPKWPVALLPQEQMETVRESEPDYQKCRDCCRLLKPDRTSNVKEEAPQKVRHVFHHFSAVCSVFGEWMLIQILPCCSVWDDYKHVFFINC